MKTLLLAGVAGSAALAAFAQQPAFPGAEGFGRFARGGRGGDVYHVVNLEDSGEGSLREGIRSAHGPRTIVFDLSGTIALKSSLGIDRPNITIAGQTAPGDGITLRNASFEIGADHVIVRHIRSRLGDLLSEGDAISVQAGSDIILDHCSASWGIDECLSAQSGRVDRLTVQWCLVAESLHNSSHHKGAHGKGGIIGSLRQSYHNNLFADHMDRNPKVSWRRHCKVDFRNNVIFNWGAQSCTDGAQSHVNWVANYYKPGPATRPGVQHLVFKILKSAEPGATGDALFYIEGNHVEGFPQVSADNWAGGVQFGPGAGPANRTRQPFPYPPISYERSAVDSLAPVLAGAGASHARDAVDRRVVEEVRTGKPRFGRAGIVDSQKDVGGWPVLRSLPAPPDSDRDGLPDAWEREHGLNPHDPADRNLDRNGDGYSNLEEYLNSIVRG